MIFCDHCRKLVHRDEHCVYEQRDLHPSCVDLVRNAKTIIEFVEWYDTNGVIDASAPEVVLSFFSSWLEKRRISIAPEHDDDPRPPLPFPTR